MKIRTLVAAIVAISCAVSAHGADPSDVKRVLDRFDYVRPAAADLALYQLDWMPTLMSAKEMAAKEQRPIFLAVVTNSFGDMYSGHC
jgi:hypothetical protein